MLFEPPRSPYDVHFRLLGFPVRIHPFFWVVIVLLGIHGETPPLALLIWVGVVIVSILVHELGHAFLQRHYGGRPRIVLHGFGGLAISEESDPSPTAQIAIALAGPAAGFLFALVIVLVMNLTGHQVGFLWRGTTGYESAAPALDLGLGRLYWDGYGSMDANYLAANLLYVNIFWGLLNLLPLYPLDGGRVARELCLQASPTRGIRLSLQISIAVGAGVAVLGLLNGEFFLAILFGYLAYGNYQTLQRYQHNRWS